MIELVLALGLTVAPEARCSPYVPGDYKYTPAIERRVYEKMGGVWSPYTNEQFRSLRQTDIEHIVARSEAHDSGLCSADRATRRTFANDLLNLTLASPAVNRRQKRGQDAGEWLPPENKCWFATQVVAVKLKYGLSVDLKEAKALDSVLRECP